MTKSSKLITDKGNVCQNNIQKAHQGLVTMENETLQSERSNVETRYNNINDHK